MTDARQTSSQSGIPAFLTRKSTAGFKVFESRKAGERQVASVQGEEVVVGNRKVVLSVSDKFSPVKRVFLKDFRSTLIEESSVFAGDEVLEDILDGKLNPPESWQTDTSGEIRLRILFLDTIYIEEQTDSRQKSPPHQYVRCCIWESKKWRDCFYRLDQPLTNRDRVAILVEMPKK